MDDKDFSLQTLQFNKAKTGLSSVMTDVVHLHSPRLIARHNKERMLLIETGDLVGALSDYRFEPKIILDDGEVTAALEELGVLGFGETVEEAMGDLVTELRAYTRRFFENQNFYSQTDRAGHRPWLLRFAATRPEEQLDLLRDDAKTVALTAAKEDALASA